MKGGAGAGAWHCLLGEIDRQAIGVKDAMNGEEHLGCGVSTSNRVFVIEHQSTKKNWVVTDYFLGRHLFT